MTALVILSILGAVACVGVLIYGMWQDRQWTGERCRGCGEPLRVTHKHGAYYVPAPIGLAPDPPPSPPRVVR